MKIIVYTCITGNYDDIVEVTNKEENIEYICITNNKQLKSNTWNVKYIDEKIDNWTLARKVKIEPFNYLPKHDVSIWIDGAIKINKKISEFLDKECELDKYDMVGFKHQFRNCIYDEISACVDMRKETIENANRLFDFLKKQKYPENNGLIESTVLIRKNNNDVKKLMSLWFDMIINYSRRDQLSFNYCLWKNPIKVKMLDMWVFDCKYFKHMGHKNKSNELIYRITFADKKKFDFHDAIDDKTTIVDNKVSIKHKCLNDTNKIVLKLPNETGNTISKISINNKKNGISVFNSRIIDNKEYFQSDPIILFEGDYKKNEVVKVEFELIRNSITEIIDNVYTIQEKYNELKSKYEILDESYNKVINSKVWRMAEKLRKIRK